LTASEILEQIFEAERAMGRRAQSVLFMGIGEPLANYENLRVALGAIRSPLGMNMGARHVTVSTSGVVPAILKLAKEDTMQWVAQTGSALDPDANGNLLAAALLENLETMGDQHALVKAMIAIRTEAGELF
jgi:adenine C2-methylase RlmN of 23S rRNA A2503 and tRNA A37